jgi:uncharacterized membrane protein YqhA
LTGDEIQERLVSANEESIMELINKYGTVAPIEIQMTGDLTNDESLHLRSPSMMEASMLSIVLYITSIGLYELFIDPEVICGTKEK